MPGRLQGKVAIVTGATSGIGEGTAERFVKEGAQVVLAGRSEDKGKAIAARLGKQALFCRTDVTREADIVAMVECAKNHFGRLDVLFNNAGGSTAGLWSKDVTEEGFVYDMKLLVGSVLFGAKHAAPLMKANGGGSIINNASIAGMRSGYGPVVYSAAKGGVIQLTVTLAMELAPMRIRVNAISPGTIETPIFGKVLGLGEEKIQQSLSAVGEALKDVGQLGRVGVPEDIAQAAVYLGSDESSFVTGHNLLVDAGAIMGRSVQGFLEALGSLAQAAKA